MAICNPDLVLSLDMYHLGIFSLELQEEEVSGVYLGGGGGGGGGGKYKQSINNCYVLQCPV